MSRDGERDHTKLPRAYQDVLARFPSFGKAYEAFADAAHTAGPLGDRERRVAKLALAIAARQEGGVHSQVRKCLAAGLTADEIRHVALLSVTNIGFPSMVATLTWIEDVLSQVGDQPGAAQAVE